MKHRKSPYFLWKNAKAGLFRLLGGKPAEASPGLLIAQPLPEVVYSMPLNPDMGDISAARGISTAVLYSDGEHQKSGTYDRDQLAASRAAMLLGFDPGHARPH